jgi:putative ABC transport system permease protein
MLSIGWRNLRKDPTRLGVAVFGVTFSVVLLTCEIGMLLGLLKNASNLVDTSRADIWVSTIDVVTLDFATPFDARKQYLIEAVEGVDRVEEFDISFSVWRLPSGGNANVQVVSYDFDGELGPPLKLVAGHLDELHNQDAIVIDEADRERLGGIDIGDQVEVMMRRARVVGLTSGMRAFTTNPIIFCSLERVDNYGWLTSGPDRDTGRRGAIYFLVRVKPGENIDEVRRRIEAAVPDVEAHTQEGFACRTRSYWLFETGMGIGFLVAAMLGLCVGGVIVSQTLYAMTAERLPEFGVLKALGADMKELSVVVLQQGLICGGIGWCLGIGISYAVAYAADLAGTTMLIPWFLALGVALLTAGLCSAAALVSVVRLRRIEPATVFRV